MEYLKNIDLELLLKINEYTKNILFDHLMPIITYLGDWGAIWAIISLALLASKKYRYVGFLSLCAFVLCALVGNLLLKNIFQRPRPFLALDSLTLLISKPSGFSFPSGHAMASFACGGVLAAQFKRYAMPILAFAGMIAFSRLYLLVHYPSDVLGGALLGLLCAKIILIIFPERTPLTYP